MIKKKSLFWQSDNINNNSNDNDDNNYYCNSFEFGGPIHPRSVLLPIILSMVCISICTSSGDRLSSEISWLEDAAKGGQAICLHSCLNQPDRSHNLLFVSLFINE